MKFFLFIIAVVLATLLHSQVSYGHLYPTRGSRRYKISSFIDRFRKPTSAHNAYQSRAVSATPPVSASPAYPATPGFPNVPIQYAGPPYGSQQFNSFNVQQQKPHKNHGPTSSVSVAKNGGSATSSAEGPGSNANSFSDAKDKDKIKKINQNGAYGHDGHNGQSVHGGQNHGGFGSQVLGSLQNGYGGHGSGGLLSSITNTVLPGPYDQYGGQHGGHYGGQHGGHYGGQHGGHYGGQHGGSHRGQHGGHYDGQHGGFLNTIASNLLRQPFGQHHLNQGGLLNTVSHNLLPQPFGQHHLNQGGLLNTVSHNLLPQQFGVHNGLAGALPPTRWITYRIPVQDVPGFSQGLPNLLQFGGVTLPPAIEVH